MVEEAAIQAAFRPTACHPWLGPRNRETLAEVTVLCSWHQGWSVLCWGAVLCIVCSVVSLASAYVIDSSTPTHTHTHTLS